MFINKYKYSEYDRKIISSQIMQIRDAAEKLPKEQIGDKISLHGLADALYGNTVLSSEEEFNFILGYIAKLVPSLEIGRIKYILTKQKLAPYK